MTEIKRERPQTNGSTPPEAADAQPLKTEANSASDSLQQFLTLQLEQDDSAAVTQALSALPGVISIEAVQQKTLLLCYQAQQNADFDLAVLQCLAANGWRYRNLTKGKTLEQKLFSSV